MAIQIINDHYVYNTATDPWVWSRATMNDIEGIVNIADYSYRQEISEFFTPSRTSLAWNVGRDIFEQMFDPLTRFVSVAKIQDRIVAYCWAAPDYVVWSPDAQVYVKMVHVDLSLSARQRVRIVNQILDQIHCYAVAAQIPVVVSTTMREDQSAFLRIHEQRGYLIRGSFCYGRLPADSSGSKVSSVV